MRFFFRKKDQPQPEQKPREYYVRLSGRNFDELDQCDVSLKFWLSESLEKHIDEMCSFQNTSASDLIRQILFVHLYGRYDLFGLDIMSASRIKKRTRPLLTWVTLSE